MTFAKTIKQGKLSSNKVAKPPSLHIETMNSNDEIIQTQTFQYIQES